MALFALFGAAAFLTWPIWVGPPVVTLALVVATRGDIAVRAPLMHLALALIPIAIVTAIYAAARLAYGFRLAAAAMSATAWRAALPALDKAIVAQRRGAARCDLR